MRLLVVALMAATLSIPAGAEDDLGSGTFMLPACKGFATRQVSKEPSQFTQGICVGTVDTLLVAGHYFASERRFCAPESVTVGQAIRVAVEYLDAHPELLHRKFKELATISFHAAWPCKE
jgi:hypothetical protein